jgi:hypothetical protein
MPRPGQELAWRDLDVTLLVFLDTLGVVAWLTSWAGVHYSESLPHRVAWINLGIAGLIAFGAGNSLWLLRGRRRIGARRAAMVRLDVREVTSGVVRTSAPDSTIQVQVPQGRLAHRPDCPLVAGKTVEPAEPDRTDRCQVCLP